MKIPVVDVCLFYLLGDDIINLCACHSCKRVANVVDRVCDVFSFVCLLWNPGKLVRLAAVGQEDVGLVFQELDPVAYQVLELLDHLFLELGLVHRLDRVDLMFVFMVVFHFVVLLFRSRPIEL